MNRKQWYQGWHNYRSSGHDDHWCWNGDTIFRDTHQAREFKYPSALSWRLIEYKDKKHGKIRRHVFPVMEHNPLLDDVTFIELNRYTPQSIQASLPKAYWRLIDQ